MSLVKSLFYLDNLSAIMGALILFVTFCVGSFSWRYLKGDASQAKFYRYLLLLSVSALVFASADHLIVFIGAWGISNFLLAKLMVHNPSWVAAQESGKLALKNAAIGFVALSAAGILLYAETGATSIQEVLTHHAFHPTSLIALFLLFIAAMAQSALWPFHRWLTSSLNSPTPVSAMMHAGLINGGGFLLARFALLYIDQPVFLKVIFIAGFITAFLGTLWKLMQSDVKRMLACSTMGQMGFMVMQCGLGLFPAAIAHLVWHGLFKAYLFLASGSAAQEKRLDLGYPPSAGAFLCAIVSGLVGTAAFSATSHTDITQLDTRLFLVGMSFVASAQFALPLFKKSALRNIPFALLGVGAVGAFYGLGVHLFETLLPEIAAPQPLSALHITAFVTLVAAWLAILFVRGRGAGKNPPEWLLSVYVSALNGSQPHPLTVTAYRNDYKYK